MCVSVCVRAVVSHRRRFLSNTHTRETHGRQASDVTVVIETAGLVWIGPQPLTEGALVYASLCCLFVSVTFLCCLSIFLLWDECHQEIITYTDGRALMRQSQALN